MLITIVFMYFSLEIIGRNTCLSEYFVKSRAVIRNARLLFLFEKALPIIMSERLADRLFKASYWLKIIGCR